MTPMKTLLVGFFGEGNLGDEAMLSGICRVAPDTSHFVVTSGSHPLPVKIPTIKRRGLNGWLDFLRVLPKTRRMVLLGGILQDWSIEGVTFYALRIMAARCLNIEISLWGAGLGPLRRMSARSFAGRALKKVDSAWLRDLDSQRLFLELTGRSAHLGADWSWAIPAPSRGKPDNSDSIGINLRPWFHEGWKNSAEERFRNLADRQRAVAIAARSEDLRLLKSSFPGIDLRSPADFTELLECCSTLSEGWAMRYHVVLAMLRTGIPVVPLPYDEKVRSLCREAGIEAASIMPATTMPRVSSAGFLPMLTGRFEAMKKAFLGTADN
ncbi:MAG: polysaccharide pyruvyl transferase family protein [Candidatus Riflebacteria bacterium]|nr:polysaccharide pyruvyl transferase family protein [Candidatus Riflebacteria bacterium]